MGAKRRASAAMDADHGKPGFRIHVHSVHWTRPRALAAANACTPFHSHSATLSLAECVSRTSFHAGSRVAAETDLSLESSTQTAGRADSNPGAVPRQALVQQSCTSEGARIAPNAAFHSGRAKYLHEDLPYTGVKSFISFFSTSYSIGCGCPVQDSTLPQSLPSGSIFLRAATASEMGTCVN
jgi:hypothetical protein